MGKRGPAPGTGGRPKKPLADKLIEGNPGKRELKVISLPDLKGKKMPEPRAYLSEKQKGGQEFEAKAIFKEVWEWLKERDCENLVSEQVIEHYALSAARAIQCEQCISEFGFLAKHPTTGAAIISPYVTISQNYMKQANQIWATIEAAVKENCATEYKGKSPNDDLMEQLLSARKG